MTTADERAVALQAELEADARARAIVQRVFGCTPEELLAAFSPSPTQVATWRDFLDICDSPVRVGRLPPLSPSSLDKLPLRRALRNRP